LRELGRSHPRLEVVLGRPARVDEVAALADRLQELEGLEPGRAGHRAGPLREPLLEVGAALLADGHGVYDDERHQAHAPRFGYRRSKAPATASQIRSDVVSGAE